MRVKLTKLVENTGSFAQFQFESLGMPEQSKRDKALATSPSKDFDEIWDLL